MSALNNLQKIKIKILFKVLMSRQLGGIKKFNTVKKVRNNRPLYFFGRIRVIFQGRVPKLFLMSASFLFRKLLAAYWHIHTSLRQYLSNINIYRDVLKGTVI